MESGGQDRFILLPHRIGHGGVGFRGSLSPVRRLRTKQGSRRSQNLEQLRRAPDAAQYSALNQINRSNVSRLQIAWKYRTGDGNKYLFNPIVVDGVMYVLAKHNSIVALDAATGREMWIHPTDRANQADHQSRHQLLGKRGPIGSAFVVRRQQLPAGDRCPDR